MILPMTIWKGYAMQNESHLCECCGKDANKKALVKIRPSFWKQFYVCSTKCEADLHSQKVLAKV